MNTKEEKEGKITVHITIAPTPTTNDMSSLTKGMEGQLSDN